MIKIKFLLAALLMTSITMAQESRPWFQDGPVHFPTPNPKARALPLIMVKGNKFINSKGDTILFRGLAIADPTKLNVRNIGVKNTSKG